MRRRYQKLPVEEARRIVAAVLAGMGRSEVCKTLDVSVGTFLNVVRPLGGVIRPEMAVWQWSSRLSLEDRVEIRRGLDAGHSYARIGGELAIRRHKSTICREVARNGGPEGYAPTMAHRRAYAQARRAQPTKLATNEVLRKEVEAGLDKWWSPEQIAADLRRRFGDDPAMTVSHETIYKSLYVQGRGELRRELARALRTGRAARKRRNGARNGGSRIPDMVMISERPAEVADRAVPGHWEGDLIIGKAGASAIATLVERTSRYLLLAALPDGRNTEAVRDALAALVTTLPQQLRRSLTWDQGVEMTGHARFSVDTGVPVYFCDPHSPWQRGSNENTNGLLRQYLPKGTDLSAHTPEALAAIADSLNTRPRKTLGWQTPAQRLHQIVATTG